MLNHFLFISTLFLISFLQISSTERRVLDKSTTTEVELNPIFKPTNRNITVGPGERAVLKCRIENLGTKTVTWRRDGDVHPLTIGLHPFAQDHRVTVDFNQRTMEWSLIIQDVKPTDEGIYRCLLSTKIDKHSFDIRLNVKTIQVTGTDYVEKGSPIQLVCNVTGKPDPPHNIDWFRGTNKVLADSANGIIITKKIESRVLVSTLVIRQSRTEDSGEYVCKSSDKESSSIKVHVLNVPGPETEVNKASTPQEKVRQGSIFSNVRSRNISPSHSPNIPSVLVALLFYLLVLKRIQR